MDKFENGINIDPKIFNLSVNLTKETNFLKGYSEFGFSIFEEEVEKLKEDLNLFAAKDGNLTNLSEEESIEFYNATMKKINKDFKPIKSFEKGKNPVINFIKQHTENYYKSFEIVKELKKATNKDFQIGEAEFLIDINKKQMNYIKSLIKEDKENRLRMLNYFEISENSTIKDIEKFKKLLKIDFLSEFEFPKLIKLNPKEFQKLEELATRNISKIQISTGAVEMLTKLPENQFTDIINNYPNFNAIKLNDELLSITKESQNNPKISEVYDIKTKKQIEKITTEYLSDTEAITIENFNNNTIHTIYKRKDKYGRLFTETQTISKYDENKNLLSKETIVQKEDGSELLASITDKTGIQHPSQWSTIDKETGLKTIQRDLISPTGTKTNYYYEETPEGIQISEYKITDKNGKILLNEKRTFQPVMGSDNKFISTVNNKTYFIEHTENEIIVTDKQSNQTTTINLNDIETDNKKELTTILKKLSGDKLISLNSRNLNKLTFENIDNGSFDNFNRSIDISSLENSSSAESQLNTLLHEFGHYLDTAISDETVGEISNSKEFLKIYNKELKALKKHSNSKEQEYIDYFTIGIRGRQETVAESTMALSTAYTSPRTYFLQKYFPETIATVAKLIAKQNNYLT